VSARTAGAAIRLTLEEDSVAQFLIEIFLELVVHWFAYLVEDSRKRKRERK